MSFSRGDFVTTEVSCFLVIICVDILRMSYLGLCSYNKFSCIQKERVVLCIPELGYVAVKRSSSDSNRAYSPSRLHRAAFLDYFLPSTYLQFECIGRPGISKSCVSS